MKEPNIVLMNSGQLKAYFSEYVQFVEQIEQLCFDIRAKERKIFGQPVTIIVNAPDSEKMVVNVTWLLIQHIQRYMELDAPGLQIEVLDVLKKIGTYIVFENQDTIELSGLSIQLCQKGLNFHFSPEISSTFRKFLEIQ